MGYKVESSEDLKRDSLGHKCAKYTVMFVVHIFKMISSDNEH